MQWCYLIPREPRSGRRPWPDGYKEASKKRSEVARDARRELAADRVSLVYDNEQIAIKNIRQAAAAKGLWWSNYNSVLTAFDGARSRIKKTGGNITHKYFNGEGRLTVQIQGGATAEELFSRSETGGRKEVWLIDGPPSGWETRYNKKGQTPPNPSSKRSLRKKVVTLVMTVYTSRDDQNMICRRVINVPVVYDRPLPADGQIRQVTLTRRRGARFPTGDWRYEVAFIMRVPAPPARLESRMAAIHIGWRTVDDGVRVATIVDENCTSHFVLPASLAERFEAASKRLGVADTAAESMRDAVTTWIISDAPQTIITDLEAVRHSRSGSGAARSMRLMAQNWSVRFPNYRPDLLETLNVWFRADLIDRWVVRNIQAKAVRHRRDLVRVWISDLEKQYDTVIVQQYSINRLRRKDTVSESVPSGRRNIQITAPGEVRANMATTLKSRGVRVVQHYDKVSWVCHRCGVEGEPTDTFAVRHRCQHCGSYWDVDENAATNALAVLKVSITDKCSDGTTASGVDDQQIEPNTTHGTGRFTRHKPSPKVL